MIKNVIDFFGARKAAATTTTDIIESLGASPVWELPTQLELPVFDTPVRDRRMANTVVDETAFFPVRKLSNFDIPDLGVSNHAAGFCAIVRTDTNRVLGLHKVGYGLISHEDAVGRITEKMATAGIDLEGSFTKTKIAQDGAVMVHDIYVPSYSITVPSSQPDDRSILRIRTLNSYNGATSLTTQFGAYRLVCENGMAVGHDLLNLVARHTVNNISNDTLRIAAALQTFEGLQATWSRWATKTITTEMAEAAIRALPGITDTLAVTLLEQYEAEQGQLGGTLWALYNAMTNWATHSTPRRQASAANIAYINVERERRISTLIHTPQWQALELAA